MDDSNQPRRAGFGRARARVRGRSPGSIPSPDPSLLSSARPSSSRGESSAASVSASAPSGVASVIPPMKEMDLDEPIGMSGLPRGAMRGRAQTPFADAERAALRDERRDFVVTRPDGSNKQGQKGRQIDIHANYFRLRELPTWSLQQYSVKFEEVGDAKMPAIDRVSIRKKLFRKALEERQVGVGYMFDGAQLYTARRLEDNNVPMEMIAQLDNEDDPQVSIKVAYIGKVDPGSPIYVQLHNILIRKCLFAMKLQEMGRNFFDPEAAIKLTQQKLELWPGFVTSMRTHEQDVLLCVEVTHKVLRTDTVLQIIRGIENNVRGDDKAKKAAVVSELQDTVVMTIYNKQTYHVDDIDFDQSPRQTFDCKGEQLSLADYYQMKYGLKIKDLTQPLIVCRPSKRDAHRGKGSEKETPKAVLLIPELCQSTGLTDAMRADFRLMSELSKYLHQQPKEKVLAIEKFMKRLKANDEIRREFANWGLEFENELVNLPGRVLGNETILFAKGSQPVDQKGDFTLAFRSQQMISAVQLNNWVVLAPQRDAPLVDNLVRTMSKVATPLSMRIANPNEVLILPDTRNQTYLRLLDEAVNAHPGIQMIFIILPTNKLDLYAAVKKRLAVDQGIPSQCFLSKNVASKGLMSIATKVVVQMNAKLGGEPWTVKLPLKNTMFVGFDVHKGGKNIIGAMVATFSPYFTKYYSTTTAYTTQAMISTGMQGDLLKCVLAYQEENQGALPEKIFMYRDGVGEGQLTTVFHVELVGLKEALQSLYEAHQAKPPGLTYIVVSKRINTRLIEMKATGYANPPPGTIVDSVVTLPERYDFYLISCGARQGTVSPCSYNVLCDESGLDADKIQLITYKMTHLYFNWSGTIAVPAPCQYAHKLAFLTGMAYSGQANVKLSRLLHFL